MTVRERNAPKRSDFVEREMREELVSGSHATTAEIPHYFESASGTPREAVFMG
jgi:hypothetical protein